MQNTTLDEMLDFIERYLAREFGRPLTNVERGRVRRLWSWAKYQGKTLVQIADALRWIRNTRAFSVDENWNEV